MIVRHRLSPALTVTPAAVDRTFGQIVNSLFETPSFGPAVRADWHGDDYVVTVDLPGIPAEAVAVEVTGSTLRLAATSGESEWSRSLRLGGSLDPNQVSARHVDGRLTVRIGKVAEPAARQIAIDTAAATTPVLDAEPSAPASTD